MIDFHVHSTCSGDAYSSTLDMCRAAIDRGVTIICFTEHVDFHPTDVCYGQFDYDLYKSRITEARSTFGSDTALGGGTTCPPSLQEGARGRSPEQGTQRDAEPGCRPEPTRRPELDSGPGKACPPSLQEGARGRSSDSNAPTLDIRFGIEVDFLPRYAPQIEDLLSRTEFDYVLGSAHYVGNTILEDHELYFPGKSADEAYLPYLQNALKVVKTGWFDTLAHMDLCKRNGVRYYGAFDWQPYRGLIEETLHEVIDRDMALEINTSGLRQAPEDTYPGRDILELYYLLGGRKITIGSDAHRASDVAAGIPTALALARSIGFTHLATFRNRQCSLVPLMSS